MTECIKNDFGSVAWDIVTDDDSNPCVKIISVWTDAEHRGKGNMRRNMEAALEDIQLNYPDLPVRLLCDAPYESSMTTEQLREFYERLGFVVERESDGCYEMLLN
jgi:predicted GNAT family N-acyltransferase